ncbi:glycoside hydrolase family 35 protein [Pseudoduganella sp. OTU4001]|uniref:glycoside hydrolase family 35 protein n=1 Tax=Pseudoduganella sp. OTU4001 TaxID=3043854 RepID=UPI00313A8D4D
MQFAVAKRLTALALVAAALGAQAAPSTVPHFAPVGDHFELDGKPFVIRSGEVHYARVPREFWRERLQQMRAMGLNTVTTYVFWNRHEPEPGRFDFSGDLDLAAFIRTARDVGLKVVLRPGPYVCAELDFGGFPAWLLRTPGLRVRSLDPRFMSASARYLKRVAQEVAPLLSSRGGPILMVQVENEYGSYGDDRDYMAAMLAQFREAGFDLPLFTSDGPSPSLLERGTLPGVTSVVNFNGNVDAVKRAFAQFASFRQNAPRMSGEYWAGWFDSWGSRHAKVSPAMAGEAVDYMLGQGISFNLYMAHGGTSFGWMPGANSNGTNYTPDTTSYDYDAAIDEAGRPTRKFHAIRAAIARHLPAGEKLPDLPAPTPTISVPRFSLIESVPLVDTLQSPIRSKMARNMEAYGQGYGFILYRKRFEEAAKGKLELGEARDYIHVMADGATVATVDRRRSESSADVSLKAGSTLDLLVENMGRVNFGASLPDERKGLMDQPSLGGKELNDWEVYPLPLADLSGLRFKRGAPERSGPTFWRGKFRVEAKGSTFLDMRGMGKGHVWVNGHHLGRYWRVGPQQSLFVPAPWLRAGGDNEIIILDLDGAPDAPSLQGLPDPVFTTSG